MRRKLRRRVKSAADRFWEKVDQSGGPDACWPWEGARSEDGQRAQRFRWSAEEPAIPAAQAAWRLAHPGEEWPSGLWALHTCDHGWCVNPGHIYPGTFEDNARDFRERRRARPASGERHPWAKFTDAQVAQAVAAVQAGLTVAQAAREAGMSAGHLGGIVRGVGRQPVRGEDQPAPAVRPRRERSVVERWIDGTEVDATTGCWRWATSQTRTAPRLMQGRVSVLVRSVAWEVSRGTAVPDGMAVGVSCGVPECSAPEHLRLTPARGWKGPQDRPRTPTRRKSVPAETVEAMLAAKAAGATWEAVVAQFGVSRYHALRVARAGQEDVWPLRLLARTPPGTD